MATVTASRPWAVQSGSRIAWVGELVLASYGQIFFRGSLWVGAALLLTTFLEPVVGLFGLAAVLTAAAVARLAGLSPELLHEGLYGYGPLLVGLGVGASYEPTLTTFALSTVGAIAMVPVSAAAQSAMWTAFSLPPLTVPFLLVFNLVAGGAQVLGLEPGGLLGAPALLPSGFFSGYLRSLGAILFLPRADVGLGVAIALFLYSRIGGGLSLLGFAAAWLLWPEARNGTGITSVIVGYNFMLTAVALGGVWFVASLSSLALAGMGTLVCGLVALGSMPYLARGGLPLLVLPFNATVLLFLYAMRQRIRDAHPKSVDFLLGSPEENLRYYLTREARFGSHYSVRLSAPVMGEWVCTQGSDGPYTHQGAWRHAFDLEVQGRDGKTHQGQGLQLQDYHCYGLPVLAPAEATVVKVVDGVPDSPVGRPNLDENWGNLVLLQHAVGLYSLLCHLSPGSISVKQGQMVRRGEAVARCGSSGRAPVPHLHMHLQATNRIGAPTILTELHDVVVASPAGGGSALVPTRVPAVGDKIRNLEPDPTLTRLFEYRYEEPLRWEREGRAEVLVPEIDLYGSLSIHSKSFGARLYYDLRPDLFTVFDVGGSRRSALYLMQVALPRVPLEADDKVEWEDEISRVPGSWLVGAAELVTPFGLTRRLRMRYRRTRTSDGLLVQGSSLDLDGAGQSLVTTEAELRNDRGLIRVQVFNRGRNFSAHRPLEPSKEVSS